ncbi:hypothetical protein DIPPA_29071 [Diplonema papillatum]|nr:hypothetical protein DIPPA_29071 [Diplonema papillatum]
MALSASTSPYGTTAPSREHLHDTMNRMYGVTDGGRGAAAAVYAEAMGGRAAAAAGDAAGVREQTQAQAARTAAQARAAEAAAAAQHNATEVHASALVDKAHADVDVSGRAAQYSAAVNDLAVAEAVTHALQQDTAAVANAAEQAGEAAEVHRYNAASLEQLRNGKYAEVTASALRASTAKMEAANASATAKAAGAAAFEASSHCQIHRSNAESATLASDAADRRRDEVVAAASAASQALRDAIAAERALADALQQATKEAERTRIAATKHRANATAKTEHAQVRAMLYEAASMDAQTAVQRAAADGRVAADSEARLIMIENSSKSAVADAGAAGEQMHIARDAYRHAQAGHSVALQQQAHAHASVNRAGQTRAIAEANHARATSREAVARSERVVAVNHASVHRARVDHEQAALASAQAHAIGTTTAEAVAVSSAVIAEREAARAGSIALDASIQRAIHDNSPRHVPRHPVLFSPHEMSPLVASAPHAVAVGHRPSPLHPAAHSFMSPIKISTKSLN